MIFTIEKKAQIKAMHFCVFLYKTMQTPIQDDVHLPQSVDPRKHTDSLQSIDIPTNFQAASEKLKNLFFSRWDI